MWWTTADFSREFVIDEKPEPLYSEDTGSREEGDDLLALVSRVMRENERLADLAVALERSRATGDGTQRVVKSLLPVLDSFERVCELARRFPVSEQLINWLKSVESVYFRLRSTLERLGLEVIDPLGKTVDLDSQEVVEYRPTNEYPGDTVIEVRQKGYRFRGTMLRDAQVVVAHNNERS